MRIKSTEWPFQRTRNITRADADKHTRAVVYLSSNARAGCNAVCHPQPPIKELSPQLSGALLEDRPHWWNCSRLALARESCLPPRSHLLLTVAPTE